MYPRPGWSLNGWSVHVIPITRPDGLARPPGRGRTSPSSARRASLYSTLAVGGGPERELHQRRPTTPGARGAPRHLESRRGPAPFEKVGATSCITPWPGRAELRRDGRPAARPRPCHRSASAFPGDAAWFQRPRGREPEGPPRLRTGPACHRGHFVLAGGSPATARPPSRARARGVAAPGWRSPISCGRAGPASIVGRRSSPSRQLSPACNAVRGEVPIPSMRSMSRWRWPAIAGATTPQFP